jgi:hypothetical protein
MSDLFIYSTPANARVTLSLDGGQVIVGAPGPANGRSDAHRLTIPAGTPSQGAVLKVTLEGHESFQGRGVLVASSSGDAQFMLDDVQLVPLPPAQPAKPPITTTVVPPKPDPKNPQAIISAIFATGAHSLATKEGCGKFTEACCTALHEIDAGWGHIRKNPGQNQFNGHAVDAIQLKAGDGSGIYDIIENSESLGAKPAFMRKEDANQGLWFFPA